MWPTHSIRRMKPPLKRTRLRPMIHHWVIERDERSIRVHQRGLGCLNGSRTDARFPCAAISDLGLCRKRGNALQACQAPQLTRAVAANCICDPTHPQQTLAVFRFRLHSARINFHPAIAAGFHWSPLCVECSKTLRKRVKPVFQFGLSRLTSYIYAKPNIVSAG